MSKEVRVLGEIIAHLENGKGILEEPSRKKNRKLKSIWSRYVKELHSMIADSEGNAELVRHFDD